MKSFLSGSVRAILFGLALGALLGLVIDARLQWAAIYGYDGLILQLQDECVHHDGRLQRIEVEQQALKERLGRLGQLGAGDDGSR